jgi:hypothetical protein
MADLKITQLPSASIATGSNVLPIVQGGATDQITVTNLGQGIFNLNLPLTASSVTNPSYIDFNLTASVTQPVAGRLSWNSSDGTLDLGMKGGNVTQQIGEEIFYEVRNDTGTPLANGTSVYANGVTTGSGRITAAPFVADGSVREVRYLGLATEDISNGVNGFVTHFGYVRDLDTRGNVASSIAVGNETWAVGDILYAHPTVPGKLTNIKPKHDIVVCIIIVRHQNVGSVFVRPSDYGHIDDLHDVNINTSSLSTGDLLIYDSGSDYWTNSKQLTGSYGLTGSLNATSFTGSLLGTASYATQALTASYVNPLNQTVEITGSLQVQNSIDSSLRFLFDSTGTASLDWEDGYLYNGSGSISVDWRDKKLYDSNVANSVNWDSRQLFKSDGTTVTLNWETGAFTGSMLGTASYATQALSSSYAQTASYVQTSQTASYVLSASYAQTASYVQNAQTASYVLQAVSASFATTASYVQNAQSASYVLQAVSASFSTTASYVQNAQSASYVLNAVSASFATTASYVNSLRQTVQVTGSLNVTGSVYINNALYSNQTNTLATENKILYSIPTSTYDALFVEYIAKNGSNARAGQIMSATDGTSVKYTETTTTDIGSTSPITFNISVVGGNIRLEASASTSTWTIKTITRAI